MAQRGQASRKTEYELKFNIVGCTPIIFAPEAIPQTCLIEGQTMSIKAKFHSYISQNLKMLTNCKKPQLSPFFLLFLKVALAPADTNNELIQLITHR